MSVEVYRARWLLPVSRPPIAGGWLAIDNDEIVELGTPLQSPPRGVIDLGDIAILPALVNAHTHLEFSQLSEPIGHPGIELQDWIGQVIAARGIDVDADDAIRSGLERSAAIGTGLLGEIATTPWSGRINPINGHLDVVAFAEVLGLGKTRGQERLNAAEEHIKRLAGRDGVSGGVSPHAPYSTPPQLVERCVELAKRHHLPLAMHVAESETERALIEHGNGPFMPILDRLLQSSSAPQQSLGDLFPWGHDATLKLLRQLAGAPRSLVVHGNHLNSAEIDFLSREPQMTVVYCPRTHAFFQHPTHPVAKLLAAGVRVALGTDSLASNPDLSIWGEVRWLLGNRPDLDWQSVLAMATMNGADALGRRDLGRIEPGAKCRLIVIPTIAASENQLGNDLVATEPQPFRGVRK